MFVSEAFRFARGGVRRIKPRLSLLLVERLLQTCNHSNNRAVPKHGGWRILPVRVGCVENRLIPVESLLDAAIRYGLPGLLLGDGTHCLCHDMLWIPKLPHPLVGNSSQRTPAWRSPVGDKDRLPDDQNAHFSVWMPS